MSGMGGGGGGVSREQGGEGGRVGTSRGCQGILEGRVCHKEGTPGIPHERKSGALEALNPKTQTLDPKN